MIEDASRAKRRDETHHEWQQRVAELDANERDRSGPLVTPEAEQHADYRDEFVMHVESYTMARTKRVRKKTSIEAMFERGTITKDQFQAALEIEMAVAMIEGDVSVRGASLESRVDCTGSAGGLLVERMWQARLQMTYSRWRVRLPMPRRMVIDMLVQAQPMVATARSYRTGWRSAFKRLDRALDDWIVQREKVNKEIDERDLAGAQHRAGGGVIV